MLRILKTRFQQKYRTMAYPNGPSPDLPPRFAGYPTLEGRCEITNCHACTSVCPTGAIKMKNNGLGELDIGKCLFCRACERVCPQGKIRFSNDHQLASATRNDLIVKTSPNHSVSIRNEIASRFFSRSLKLRQVSAGGCNACEADTNVLGTPFWDMGRFGIQFVASPRHADGLLITGPVTMNMKLALEKTYAAVAEPKIVIAVGACAISGGPYAGHEEQNNGVSSLLPVDLFIPGCPPHPLTILDGLLEFIGRI